jgi:hypothetical protein
MAPVRSGVVPPRFCRAAVAATVLAAAGCGLVGREPPRPDIAPNVARIDLDGRRTTVPLTACGREGDVVVLGGAEDGTVVLAQADLGDGGRDRTGVTLDLGGDAGSGAGGIWGAFGADMPDGPAGEITGVRVEGDLVVIEGTWVPLDGDLTPPPLTAARGGRADRPLPRGRRRRRPRRPRRPRRGRRPRPRIRSRSGRPGRTFAGPSAAVLPVALLVVLVLVVRDLVAHPETR